MNAFILETLASQQWLTEEQFQAVQNAVALNPSLDIFQFLSPWLGPDHIKWLREVEAAAASSASGQAPPLVSSSSQATVQIPTTAADLKIEVAPDGAFKHLDDYLKLAKFYDASDVHVGVAAPPMMRRYGCLQTMWPDAPLLTAPQTERLLMGFLSENRQKHLRETGDLDFCYEAKEIGRFRTSVVRQRLGFDGVFRIIESRVRTMQELELPENLKGLTKYQNGLILVTGAVGSGKSTTLAALVEEVNKERHDHIITLEDPIEYLFEAKSCQVTQREVHTHTKSFATALRAALREDPDVIMVGEMRDLETISLAITASETGHLVLGTLHTSSAARTMDRILDAFPVEQQSQIRTMVAGSLRGVVSQQLVPRADGKGRALALEILINTPASAALIRDGKTFMIPGVMQTGKKLGCRLMDDSLLELLTQGIIAPREAYERASQKMLFKEYLDDDDEE